MRERPNRHAWRACVAQATVGSNPTPSALTTILGVDNRSIARLSTPRMQRLAAGRDPAGASAPASALPQVAPTGDLCGPDAPGYARTYPPWWVCYWGWFDTHVRIPARPLAFRPYDG